MNPEAWARVKQIFQAALDLPAADRRAFVRAEAGGDEELLREVESLLASEESSADFLADSAADYVPGALEDEPDANVGRRIGPYQIVREIGAGGMGAVYLAERVDEFRQQAALKLMRRGMDSRAVVARFRHERQILAGLDHRNIARLLDGGATDDGRPYFVMEHVDGAPIDEYCAKSALSIPDRVRLFLQVCEAVQYAHQNLVVHRDLKPGNILVTADGTPKLLDFGIAKLLRQDESEETAGLTQMGLRLMTPEYASPEQARGLPVAAGSDVYSLGVILYELLTGKPPYSFATRSPVEVERVIGAQDPVRPSLSAPDAARQLAGDLDVILLKALEKEPQRRYGSVEQFAGDLRRHLDGIPIVARPQTWGYRAGRFVRRNRLPVAAAALVVLSLAGGLIATAWQARVARAERARAERNFNDVRHLAQSFLFDLHDRIKDLPGSTDAGNLVVETAANYLRRLGSEARGDATLAREVAEAYLRLGDVQGNPYGSNRGDTAAAMASYREALRIAEELTRANPGDGEARRYLARAHRLIGELTPQTGDPADAVPHFRAAIAALEGQSDGESRQELARDYEMLGDVLGHRGLASLSDPAGARAADEKALGIHESLGNRRGAAILRMKLGDLDSDRGDAAAALRNYEPAEAALRELSAADPANATARRAAGLIEGKLAATYDALGRSREAVERYREANEIARQLMEADPNNRQARMGYVVSLKNHADRLFRSENQAGAMALYRQALDILGPMSKAEPDNLFLRGRYAEMLVDVGYMLALQKQKAEAERLYREGFRLLKGMADRPGATADDLNTYAEKMIDCKVDELLNPGEAVAYARRAVAASRGEEPQYLEQLARALALDHKAAEAVATQQKVLAMLPPSSPERKEAEERLARYRKGR